MTLTIARAVPFALALLPRFVAAQEDWRNVAGYLTETYSGAAMAEAPANRVLRFGGYLLVLGPPGSAIPIQQVPQDVTQLWDGQSWTTVTGLPFAPPARTGAMLAFDGLRQRTVLHGGLDGNGALRNDTWEWNGVQWNLIVTPTAPPPRLVGGMAFDGQRIVLFGGADGANQFLGDTWSFDGATWTQRATPVAPQPRRDHAMAGGNGEVLVFGGSGQTGAFADTWRWNGAVWSQVVTPVAPTPRIGAAMTFDPIQGRWLLYGGLPFTLRDTWQFVGGQWSQLATARHPASTVYGQSAFHLPTGRWVVTSSASSPSPPNSSVTSEFGADLAYVSAYGALCSSNLAGLSVAGPLTLDLVDGQPRPGSTFVLATGGRAGLGVLSLGWSDTTAAFGALPFALTAIGGPVNCMLWNSADYVTVLPPLPQTQVALTLPNNAALVGLRFFAQGFDLPFATLLSLRVTGGLAIGIDVN